MTCEVKERTAEERARSKTRGIRRISEKRQTARRSDFDRSIVTFGMRENKEE
jgi:hypothetical protein